ncbi:HAD-IB family hydrolase [Salinispirillum sp. LH 10-3-1]|uniref:HAD-IB family hydrolase n=1 Tax=Salinispirillum sp. LH 10-3-1 TaxID=2952525 RepID=A0AB38YH73_9GAMM
MKLAIFDLDNTLLAGDSDHAWGEFLVAKGIVSNADHRRANDHFYQQYVAGTLDIHEYVAFVTKPLQQLAEQERNDLRAEFVQEVVQPMIAAGAPALLQQHRLQGHDLLIITATNRFVTAPIADLLDVPNLLATDLEMRDGEFTGRIAGTPAFQAGKISRLHAWLAERDKAYTEHYFYSDSHNDLPLLKEVAHPVAVDPDDALLATAEELGWPVISLR